MLHKEIIAVCPEIHTKRINLLYGKNVEYSDRCKVHKVTT
jgi:hypothetical protein